MEIPRLLRIGMWACQPMVSEQKPEESAEMQTPFWTDGEEPKGGQNLTGGGQGFAPGGGSRAAAPRAHSGGRS